MSCMCLPLQASLKKLMEYIQTGAADKVAKLIDKGLDPNYHDPDTGGEVSGTALLLPVRVNELPISAAA